MITNIHVSPRIINEIERQLRSNWEPLPAQAFVDQGIALVDVIGALVALERWGRATLGIQDGIVYAQIKGDTEWSTE